MAYGDFLCNTYCPYFLTIQAILSSPIVEDGCLYYNFYDDGSGGEYCCFDVGFYCSNGYILHSEYLPTERKEYKSDGSGSYFTSTYCASGEIYSCSNYNIFISQLSNCYPNGFNIVKHDGDGGFYPDSEFCPSGHLFDSQNCADYSYGYFSNGTGSYYAGIFNYCSSGTCFCSSNYLIPLPPSNNLYCFGTFDVIANGSGNRFCSNFNYENYGTTIYTNFLSDCSVSYNSDGTGFYYTGIDYCSFGYVFCIDNFYLNILNTGCYQNGIYSIVADGSGNRTCQLSDQCFSGFLFEHIDVDLFNSLEIYSDGTGSFYQCYIYQSGVITYQENSCILLPNDCYYLSSSYKVLENISGCKACQDFVYVNSGNVYYTDLFEQCSINYLANGSGNYYFNTGYCESGYLLNTGSCLIQLPDLNYYVNGITGLYTDGTGGCYTGVFVNLNSGSLLYSVTYDNCKDNYISDGSGYYLCFSNYCDYGFLFATGAYCIQLPNLNYYNNGTTGLYADGYGSRFLSGYSHCALTYEFLCSGGVSYKSDGTGWYYSQLGVAKRVQCLTINWDFDLETKNKYFSPAIESYGEDLFISLSDNLYCFYEINPYVNTNIFIREAYSNNLLTSNNTKPFIYVKNIGTGCLFFNSSLSGQNNQYWSFNNFRLSGISQASGTNYLIRPNEGSFFSIRSDIYGTSYFSTSCYPFAFFYEATNINAVNSGLIYPIINSGIYDEICNYPSYTDYDYSYNQVKTFLLNTVVDDCSSFRIKFEKTGCNLEIIDCFNTGFKIYSCFGNDFHESCITVNSYLINTNNSFSSCDCFSGAYFDFIVDEDYCVTIYYNLDSCTSKFKKYFYCYSGSGSESGVMNTSVFEDAANGQFKLNNNFLENNTLYEYLSCDTSNLFVYAEPCVDYSIIDVCAKDINISGIYLPLCSDWYYCYCFNLFSAGELFQTGTSGNWVDITQPFCCDYLVNYINLLHCSCDCYLTYCPSMYSIDINYDDNKYSTLDIQNKNTNFKSEDFILNAFTECSFYYKCLEFKYISYNSLVYTNQTFDIVDCCVPLIFSGSYCSVCVDFPIRALSIDKLKLVSEYETLDRVNNINFNLNYSFLPFSFSCCESNSSCFTFPKAYNSSINKYESPCVNLQLNSQLYIQKNIELYIDPVNEYIADPYYGLNNFLLFINSEVNSGCANLISTTQQYYKCSDFYCLLNQISGESGYYACDNCINLCSYFDCCESLINYISGSYYNLGYNVNIQFKDSNPLCCVCTGYAELSGFCLNDCYQYQSSDYNLLFLDLENEITQNNYCVYSTGYLFYQYSTSSLYSLNSLVPYKNSSGDGYSYIFPILSNLTYLDCFNSCVSGFYSGKIQENNNLNFCKIDSLYWGGSSGSNALTGSAGEITGYYTVLNCFSNFIYFDNNYVVNFNSSDIENTISSRCICISKKFNYTGLQPICFVSNYALLNIREPILNSRLLNYCCDIKDSCFCEIFYYSYDITKIKQTPITILAPESTVVNYVCWKDYENEKTISIQEPNKSFGNLQKNVSQINFAVSGQILNNDYFFNSSNTCYICINIIGDI